MGLGPLWDLPFIDRAASMDGSDGVNAVFDVEHFDEVAAIMRPKRRRRMTTGQQLAAIERLREYLWWSSEIRQLFWVVSRLPDPTQTGY